MDDIARACELAKGTLYLHFKSKEELLSEIIYKAFTMLYEMMSSYQNGIIDPIERLRKIGEAHFEFYHKYPEHFRLLNQIHSAGKVRPDIEDEKHNMIHEIIMSIWNLNMEIIKDGKQKGIFKESADPLEVAVSLWSVSTSMIALHDFVSSMSGIPGHNVADMPFVQFDFLNTIKINARRIIYSILKNPPADFDLMK
jgi:AcrR family transcriptional regulator